MSIGSVLRAWGRGTLLVCCPLLWSSSVQVVEPPEIIPPRPGEFLENIPYGEYLKFDVPKPNGPIFDIRDYGAVGDGRTVNTRAINAAVRAACVKGGGVVLIPGGDFISGTIQLESNITLHIARDGILRASRDILDYNPFVLLRCEKSKQVVIEGPGRIRGEGEAWWNPPRKVPPQIPPETFDLEEAMAMHFAAKRGKLPKRPSPFLQLRESSDLTVRNLIIENSPGWTLLLDRCDRVRVEHVVISNNYHGGNTDGIDVVASSDVEIRHCFIATGDDGIVLKNGFSKDQSRAMARIRISDCAVMSSTNCFKIGTETYHDISDVRVSDCTFFVDGIWPRALSGIAIESVDGAAVSRVEVRNITMRNIMAPIFIRLGNRNRGKSKDRQGGLKDVRIEKVKATGAEFPCTLSGIPDLYIREVQLSHIDIAYREAGERLQIMDPVPEEEEKYPEFAMFGDLPAFGLWARHVDGLRVDNFKVMPRSSNTREKYVWQDVRNAHLPAAR